MKRILASLLAVFFLLGCTGTGPVRNDVPPGAATPPGPSPPDASQMKVVELANGTIYNLEAREAYLEINGGRVPMLSYNGQIPGPVLRVRQGSTIWVNFTNSMPYNTTVHWHGIRLENRYDGVPGVTQPPVPPGGTFVYKIDFPDEGMYWYHPHVREEMQQELGLYGVIIVEPEERGYFDPVDREEIIALDDILMKGSSVQPFPADSTNFALMGRFGNVMLVNGKADYRLKAARGEKIRFYILNAANVRPFNFSIHGAKMKVVAGDGSKFEKSYLADSILITPSERYIAEAVFDSPGEYEMRNDNPLGSRVLGKVIVTDSETGPMALSGSINDDIGEELGNYSVYFDKEPDFEYELTVEIEGMMGGGMMGMMGHAEDGIEWEDTMAMMNRNSDSSRVKWIIRDKKTGKTNMEAMEEVQRGRPVKIRFDNLKDSDHPMQHTMHIHGAQFLVLESDGKRSENLVWKDSVNIPIGGSVELLAIFPNEGEWMVHCHIAEHLGSGMMTSLDVH